MQRVRVSTLSVGVALAGVGLVVTGCGGNRAASPGVGVSGDPFNQLTTESTVDGFREFAGDDTPALSDDQLAQIEELQAQLDAGVLTQDEFAAEVHTIIGDFAPHRAFAGFGFFGSPFATRFDVTVGILLNLSDDQIERAREIFLSLHEDIAGLRSEARERIIGLLTEEQLAQLETLHNERGDAAEGRGFGRRAHGRGFGHGRVLRRLAEFLDLSEQQQTEIRAILDELAQAIRARHMQAREEFRAILTEDQLAFLDDLERIEGSDPAVSVSATGVRPGTRQ